MVFGTWCEPSLHVSMQCIDTGHNYAFLRDLRVKSPEHLVSFLEAQSDDFMRALTRGPFSFECGSGRGQKAAKAATKDSGQPQPMDRMSEAKSFRSRRQIRQE